jgi:serine/threonine protein kinase
VKSARAGQIVFGRYLLERELARGGMSSVWVATDRKLKREVAIKLMAPDYATSDTARRRFEREAMTVAKLQSPHIVQIYDYGIDHRTPFIVMELLVGEDLRTRLKRARRLSLQVLAPLVLQVSKGLAEAHAVGLVHRDMKPANIFLVRSHSEELAKILDFGVAKAQKVEEIDEKELTQEGSLVGTPQYMSPEQIRCLDLDFRSDLWGLGVIIYRALVGRLPFRGKTPPDLGVNICSADYVSATTAAPDLPPGVDMFMSMALARDVEDRFGSAKEMAAAFFQITPMAQPSLSMPDPRHEPMYFESGPGSQAGPPSVPSMASWPSMQTHPTAPSSQVSGIVGPPSLPSGSYSGGSYPSAPGPPSVTSITGISGPGTYPTAASAVPISVIPGSLSGSGAGTLGSAMIDEAGLAEQQAKKRRKTVLGVMGVLALLIGIGVVSVVVGGDAGAPATDGSSDAVPAAAPSASVVNLDADEDEEDDDEDEDDDEEEDEEEDGDEDEEEDGDEEAAPTATAKKQAARPRSKRRKPPPKKTQPKPPPKGGDDWDPFKSRK